MTDVLEIQFDGAAATAMTNEAWMSVLYALLEGASTALEIRRDDLDGTLYRHRMNSAPALILFDNVPGGAGQVELVAAQLPEVFAVAHQRVNRECCGPETSCYECLRNYRNQPFHGELRRGLARDFLAIVLGR
jgi:ATP-dependent helicase YprA (DUF1998 family)